MLGRKNGLGKKLGDLVGRPLVEQHCLAHRLHLAIRRAFNKAGELKFMFHLESLLNKLYSFFYNKGHKRKAYVKAIAEEYASLNLNYIFETRWIAGEKSAIVAVIKNYESMIRGLGDMSESEEFDSKTISAAKGLKKKLLMKNFFILLHFLGDLLKVLEHYSLQFQKRHGILMDQVENYEGLQKSLRVAAATKGEFLQDLLENSLCGNDKCSSIDELKDGNTVVTYKGIQLKNYGRGRRASVYPLLSQIRFTMVSALLKEVIW